ncbi:cathepsin B [Acrasis kona]|uniref:Cathepsin B n=1 Tax=Acrasis kona TaxID=1008807 RepID=A0AAW2Z7K9_9EUKA
MNFKLLLLVLVASALLSTTLAVRNFQRRRNTLHRSHHKRANSLGLFDLPVLKPIKDIVSDVVDYTKCVRFNEVENLITNVKTRTNIKWAAAHNKFDCMSRSELQSHLGAITPEVPTSDSASVKVLSEEVLAALPDNYIINQTYPNCLGDIRNQGACGNCYAITAVEVMADRLCMATKGQLNNVVLSIQQLTSCAQSNGCSGGTGTTPWNFIGTNGITTEDCLPYSNDALNNGQPGTCPATTTQCKNSQGTISSTSIYKVKPSSSQYMVVPYSKTRSTADSVALIKQEIFNNGPVEAWYQVYREFYNYRSGIYEYTNSTDFIGNHFSKIVGWGMQGTTGYWIIANSWGTGWGNKGYVWFKWGQLGIETYIYAGTPDVSSFTTAAPTTTQATTTTTAAAPTTTRAGTTTVAPTTTKAPVTTTVTPTTTKAPTTTTVAPVTTTSSPSSQISDAIKVIIAALNKNYNVAFVQNTNMMKNCQKQTDMFVSKAEPYGSGGWTTTNANWPVSRWDQILNGAPRPTKGGYEMYGYRFDSLPNDYGNAVAQSIISSTQNVAIASYLQIGIGISVDSSSGRVYYVVDFQG